MNQVGGSQQGTGMSSQMSAMNLAERKTTKMDKTNETFFFFAVAAILYMFRNKYFYLMKRVQIRIKL